MTLHGARRNRGFTLAETVVGLALASVVAAVAVPASGRLLAQYRLSTATSQIAMEVSRARMQAIGQNRYVRLKKTSAGLVREVSSNGESFTQDGDAVPLPNGIGMTFGGSGGPKFNRQGIASTSSYVLMSNEAGYRILYVNLLGRVEVQ